MRSSIYVILKGLNELIEIKKKGRPVSHDKLTGLWHDAICCSRWSDQPDQNDLLVNNFAWGH